VSDLRTRGLRYKLDNFWEAIGEWLIERNNFQPMFLRKFNKITVGDLPIKGAQAIPSYREEVPDCAWALCATPLADT
jgi:hypothetical protein